MAPDSAAGTIALLPAPAGDATVERSGAPQSPANPEGTVSRDRDAHLRASEHDRRDAAAHTRPDAEPSRRLQRLRDLDDYEVADDQPDIRGWTARTVDGTAIGEVDDLVVDVATLRVRYLDVRLAPQFHDPTRTAAVGEAIRQAAGEPADVRRPDAGEGHTLIPVGAVRLDDERDEVIVERLSSEEILGLPRYGGLALTDQYEAAVRDRLLDDPARAARVAEERRAADADPYAHEAYDDRNLRQPRPRPPRADGDEGPRP